MKGLLYKDIITNKVNLIAMGIVSLYLVFGMGLAIFEDDSIAVNITLLCGVMVLNFAFPLLGFECCFGDAKTKWVTYAMALPGGYRRMILEKYLLGIFANGIAIIGSFILIFVCKVALDIDMKLPIMMMLVTTGLMLQFQAILIPLILKNHAGVVRIIICAVILLAIYGLTAYLAFGDISFLKQENLMERILIWITKNKDRIWAICFGIVSAGIVAELLSYFLTVKTYLKK